MYLFPLGEVEVAVEEKVGVCGECKVEGKEA